MEESYLRGLPLDYDIKSLSRQVVGCKERELTNLKHQKKFNLRVRHIPEALKKAIRSHRYYAPLFIVLHKSLQLYVYKVQLLLDLSQKISRDKEFVMSMLDKLDSDFRARDFKRVVKAVMVHT